jgi:RNA polymerase sigma factor (sigma-70 family)
MNRVLSRISNQLTDVRSAADRELLDRFRANHDEAAFTELVRRYGPVVWGTCRRQLAHRQDAEDAFQATFLVLLRRAADLPTDTQLGPWLYRVAVMTARNVIRGNCRRAAVTGPMEHEVPTHDPGPVAERLDLDAALLALPERERVPVVLCHLQGLTRREAAARLGCPEGTLSVRLNRALQRLRARLGTGVPVVLTAAAVAVPSGLAAVTARSAMIDSCSTMTTVGLSPVVVGLTDGVLRMFWVKKVMTAAVLTLLVIGAGALALGTAGRVESAAPAAEPNPSGPAAERSRAAPPAHADEADALKRLEKRQAELEAQQCQLDAAFEELRAERQRLVAERKKNAPAAAITEAENTITVSVGELGAPRPYRISEVVNGTEATLVVTRLDLLARYLARAHNDPNGPKKLAIHGLLTDPGHGLSPAVLSGACAACADAGYERGVFWYTVSFEGLGGRDAPWVHQTFQADPDNYWPGPGDVVDLKTYGLRGARTRTVQSKYTAPVGGK